MPARSRHANRLPPAPSRIHPQPGIPGFIASAIAPIRANLTADAAIARMADDMRDASQREGGVTREDLELLGWTPQQVTDHGVKARTHAQMLSGATL